MYAKNQSELNESVADVCSLFQRYAYTDSSQTF